MKNILLIGGSYGIGLAIAKELNFVDEVGIFDSHIQQTAFSGCLKMCNRRFVQMAAVV